MEKLPASTEGSLALKLGRTEEPTKQTEFIFGPIERFWSSMELGDTVDVWEYEVDDGSVRLYFLNESDTVENQDVRTVRKVLT